MAEIGERVGAILGATEDEVELLGYGVYEGRFEPPTGPFGISWGEFEEFALKTLGQEEFDRRKSEDKLRLKNPRIRLDDGDIVWGQECWWGPEDKVKQMIEGRQVTTTKIDHSNDK